jgi:hypothetical protein
MPALRVDMLLAAGTIEGPFRRTRPMTVSRWRLILRALRAARIQRRGPKL